jgi:predicted oxidoreductase
VESIELGAGGLVSSRLAYGCMRIAGDGSASARQRGKAAIRAAVDQGYTLFDHADIYGGGACETIFGEVLAESPALRQDLAIATKCGIRVGGAPGADDPQRYDFRSAYILRSVEASLERLGIEHIDLCLLHRPDYLMEPDEVAAAFSALHESGKVGHFGVSNFAVPQLELLQSVVSVPLVVNQIEINLHRVAALEDGTLDHCRRLGIAVQAWCPVAGVAYPAWGNTFDVDDELRIRAELERQSGIYGVEDWQIALAWLLRHPARISPIVGSTTPARIAAAVDALGIDYARSDWYRLLEARNGAPVP